MMQWLEGLWTREGAGIDKNAPRATGLALFFDILKREWWELVKLNLLFLIASLPVVTIPAAMVAMARVSRSIVADENTYLLRDFADAFRRYAFRGTLLVAVCALVTGAGIYAVTTYAKLVPNALVYTLPLAISIIMTLLVAVGSAYAIVLTVTHELSLSSLFRRAALLALVKPLPMLAALGFVAALWLAHILLYPVSVFMPATINFSLGMFAICFAAAHAKTFDVSGEEYSRDH